jgi:DNA-directed RNA polymerase subunit M/transcription elongation factor TFIIS
MDILSARAFIPGDYPARPEPLGRFLPVLPSGVVQTYLAESRIKPGSTILDPFGASSRMVIELARGGYRVVTAVNNPITRFLMEMAASPPTRAELQSALSELAASRKGEERLETHLQSLYLTSCPQCQNKIPAQAFVWERKAEFPSSRILECPQCGNEGEFDTTPEDRKSISHLTSSAALHKARALERVATIGDPDRLFAEEALEYYLPRAIYGLITIINKLDGLSITPRQRRDLTALVLTACDETNTLWQHPSERPRPRQLVVPPRFREINLWLALEKSVDTWASDESDVPLSLWPNLPVENASVCIFEGPQRELAKHLDAIPVQAVISVLPRPNQAFWSLSALWAGWLWGREAVAPFKRVLRRQRYDWNWHAAALYAALKNLNSHLSLKAPFFALLPEPEPSFLSAALLAGAASGFDLSAIALRSSHDPLQIHWQRRAFSRQDINPIEITRIREVVIEYLTTRGEPVTYLHVHTASLAHLAVTRCLNWQVEALPKIHAAIQQALESEKILRHSGTKPSLETGWWGLAKNPEEMSPLPDRVEMALVRTLARNPGMSQEQIETAVNKEFPGLYTPQLEIVKNVLASYATSQGSGWQLRPEDSPAMRRKDLKNMRGLLESLGKRSGYQVHIEENQTQNMQWLVDGRVVYSYHVLASAVIGEILLQGSGTEGMGCLVLPGGRAGLLAYKLARDPVLKQLSKNWQLLKYRQVRLLAEDKELMRRDWVEKMGADPVTQPEQMRLF